MTHCNIDDDFTDHPKFTSVSLAAWGLWTASVAHCRHYRTDGLLVRSASFLSKIGARSAAKELVKVGLWLEVEGGFEVFNYAKKNQTKKEIDAAIEAQRVRKERWKNAQGMPFQKHSEESGNGVPALSPSLSPSLLDVPGGMQGGKVALPDDAVLTDAHRAVFATIAMNTGVKLDLDEEWAKFKNWTKRELATSGDWLASWDNWLGKAAKFAKQDALRRGPRPGPPRQKSDPNAPWLNDPAWTGAAK